MNDQLKRALLCVAACWLLVANPPQSAAADLEANYASPQATFDTAVEAMKRSDFRAFCQCFTDDELASMAGGLRLMSGIMELAGRQPNADPHSVALAKGVDRINRRYLTSGPSPEVNIDLDGSEAEVRAAMAKLAESIKDRVGYVSAVFNLLRDEGDVPKRPQPFADARLEEIKIDGNTATAVFRGTYLEPQKSILPITFTKTNGAWRISKFGSYGVLEPQSTARQQNPAIRAQIRKARAGVPASIHLAAREGNLRTLRELLRQGTDVNLQHATLGGTALHFAADSGQDEIIRELIKHKADLEAGDSRGYTALMRAGQLGHTQIVKRLLDAGSKIDAKGDVGEWTAVCLAITAKHRETAQLLVDRGAKFPEILAEPMRRLAISLEVRLPASLQPATDPPTITTRPGRIAPPKDTKPAKQAEAAITALVDVAKLKPIDQPDDKGFSKLHRTVMRRKFDQVRQLLDQGADVNVKHRTFLGTPLQYAASTGALDVAELLIKRGATVDATDSNGRTPLMWAARNGKADIVKALLDAGADVNRVNRTNWTALHFAADKGQLETAQLLIERGADLAAKSSDGKTPGEMNPNVRPPR